MRKRIGEPDSERYSTSRLAIESGYSLQQVRDLERLGVIPPACRQPNGYRQFNARHLIALRAYSNLAIAVGPVIARATMRELGDLSHDEAVASIVALHVDLARSREETLRALHAVELIADESAHEADPVPEDAMGITELSTALGVRSSTLRFWENQGLLTPERVGRHSARHYPPEAIRSARVVAALRAGGYGIPAVQTVVVSLKTIGGSQDARNALQARMRAIAGRSVALLRAGTDISELLSTDGVVTNGDNDQ